MHVYEALATSWTLDICILHFSIAVAVLISCFFAIFVVRSVLSMSTFLYTPLVSLRSYIIP